MQPHFLVLRRPVGSHCWTHEGPPWTRKASAKKYAADIRRQYRDSDVAIVRFNLPKEPRTTSRRPHTMLAYLWP